MAEHPAAGPRRSYQTILLVVAVTAAGFNLRTAVSNLPPLFPDLQTQLHLTPAALSLLAATPVICFGAAAAPAAWLNRRFGEEVVLLAALGLLTAGLLLRGVAPETMLFPGTVLAASAIAILNVLLSSMIKRRKPDRAGLLISTYLTALCVGAVIASLLAVPLYQASGGSLLLTLGVWAAPAALAMLLWLPQLRYRAAGNRHGVRALPISGPISGPISEPISGPNSEPISGPNLGPTPAPPHIKVQKYALAWQVMGFMGLQSLLYYAALSWLPTIFQDRGTSAVTAGNLLALMAAGNLVGALIVPVLAHRTSDQRALVVPSMVAMGIGLAGSLWAPLGTAAFWVSVLGIGQGSCLGLAIFFMVARAPNAGVAASLSAFAQSAGYLVASAGPLEFGLLHSLTGSWNLPAVLLLVLCGFGLVVGLFAARPLVLPDQQNATRASETGQASRAV
jgi:MFS transporter, CP family, cyanate transporter